MTWRTLIGQFGAGDYRLRRSKPGYDVMSALDPERLAFDSAWADVGVIYTQGAVAVPAVPAPGYIEIPFADTLPNVPFVISWQYVASNAIREGADHSPGDPPMFTYQPWFPTVTTTYLRFWQDRGSSTGGPDAYTAGYVVLRSIF